MGKICSSCYGETTIDGLVISGHVLEKSHYELYTYRLCSLDRARPTNSQLGSIELPIYAHLAVLPLGPPVRHITVPYVSGRV